MAVVLVDGWPTDKVEEASRLARESGINIFFVTIEGPDDNEKHNLVESNFVEKVHSQKSPRTFTIHYLFLSGSYSSTILTQYYSECYRI